MEVLTLDQAVQNDLAKVVHFEAMRIEIAQWLALIVLAGIAIWGIWSALKYVWLWIVGVKR